MMPISIEDRIDSYSSEKLHGYSDLSVANNHLEDLHSLDVPTQKQTFRFDSSLSPNTPPSDEDTEIPSISTHFNFPLSSDHFLIQLVHHNTYRALITNKAILRDNTSLMKPYPQPESVFHSNTNICDGYTIIRALSNGHLPDSLRPTQPQMAIAHSSWMNMFPFPRFRDNLIRENKSNDFRYFFLDLFGDLCYNQDNEMEPEGCLTPTPTSSLSSSSSLSGIDNDDEYNDDISAGRRCLIVWGDPWVADNWEATPGFVKKWGWLMQGCSDLVSASNRWRALRYEKPLQLNS